MPRTSTESLSRCRQCGAPLVGGKRRRACPRCHPEETASEAQLEFLLPPADHYLAPSVEDAPAPVDEPPAPVVAEPEPPQETELEVPPAGAFLPVRRPWSLRRLLGVTSGVFILAGGLGWAGFQMWPRGPVERALAEEFAAMPHFTERTGAENPFNALAVEGDSSPVLVDLDADGLLDLVTGSRSGEIRVFRNVGTRAKPRFTRPLDGAFGLVPTDTSNRVVFADLRGTALPDALNAGTNGAPTFFQNRGTRKRPQFVLLAPEDDPFAVAAAPAHSFDWRATFADIDHDGDADLFVGTRDGSILFFENRGTAQKPQFQGVTRVAPFGLRGVGELVALSFGDLDRDGDLDAVAGNAAGDLLFLHNRGNAWRPKFVVTPRGTLGLKSAGPDATVALADLDGDGDLDCIAGSADGHFRYFENLSTPPAPADPTKGSAKR